MTVQAPEQYISARAAGDNHIPKKDILPPMTIKYSLRAVLRFRHLDVLVALRLCYF